MAIKVHGATVIDNSKHITVSGAQVDGTLMLPEAGSLQVSKDNGSVGNFGVSDTELITIGNSNNNKNIILRSSGFADFEQVNVNQILKIGGDNVQINSNGSATFAGTVDAAGLTINGSPVSVDLSEYDTSAEVDAKISAITSVDLSAYNTSSEVDAKISAIPPVDLAGYDTTAQVNAKISNLENSLINGAPEALNTLVELSTALGDDSNFAGTVTNTLAGKADLSGATFTGDVTASAFIGDGSQLTGVGSETIVSSTPPTPADYEVGTLWWNSDSTDNSLYVLYQDPAGPNGDAGGKYWVEASPAPDSIGFDGTHTGNSTFTGNMSVTGSATFADYVISNEGFYVAQTAASNGSSIFKSWLGSSTYVDILDNGSAKFGTTTGGASGAGGMEFTTTNGQLDLVNTNSGSFITGYNRNSQSQVFSVGADGSASFANSVDSARFNADQLNGSESGHIVIRAKDTDTPENDTDVCFEIYSKNTEGTFNAARTRIKANGSATFAGNVNIANSKIRLVQDSNSALIRVLNSTNVDTVVIDGLDGSATFAGQVDSGNLSIGAGSRLNPSGAFEVRNDVSSVDVFNVYNGGTSNSNIVANIKSNGSATFAGDVQFAGSPINGSADGTLIRPIGLMQISSANQDAGIKVYSTGTANETIHLKPDGSATFAGAVVAGGTDSATQPTGAALTGRNNAASAATIEAINTAANSRLFLGFNENAVQTVEINNDGSAKFAAGACTIFNQGSIKATSLEAVDNVFLKADGSQDLSITLNNDGSAYFASNVGIGTTSASGVIHIKADTDQASLPSIVLEDSSTTSTRLGSLTNKTGDIILAATSSLTDRASITLKDDQNILLKTGATERMRIDSSGDVEIQQGNNLTWVYQGGSTHRARIRADSTDALIFEHGAGDQEAMRIDTSGNLKIVSEHLRFNTSGRGIIFGTEGGSDRPSIIGNYTSASDNNIVFNVTGSPRMRIDSDGRLLVGTSSSLPADSQLQVEGTGYYEGSASLRRNSNDTGGTALRICKSRGTSNGSFNPVVSGDTLGIVQFNGADGNSDEIGSEIRGIVDGHVGNGNMPGSLVFSTNSGAQNAPPMERMRIDRKGFTKFKSGESSYFAGSGEYHEFATDVNNWTIFCKNEGNSIPYGILVKYSAIAPNNTSSQFFIGSDSTGDRIQLRSNGGIANYQSNDVNLCDEREKKNIETLDSTWGCLKNWELKKFHYNEDADTDDKRYGVIAQQVAPHCPEVITDWVKQKAEDAVLDEDGNVVTPAVEEVTRMGVKEQQMMWMAIKALQEAQARIETLEAKVAALEAS